MTVSINGKEIVTAGNGFQSMAVEMYKVAAGSAVIVLPVPSFAFGSDLQQGSSNVKINGKSIFVCRSDLSKSQPAPVPNLIGGSRSGTTGGPAKPESKPSHKVMIESYVPLVKDDCVTHNNSNSSGVPLKKLSLIIPSSAMLAVTTMLCKKGVIKKTKGPRPSSKKSKKTPEEKRKAKRQMQKESKKKNRPKNRNKKKKGK